MKKFLILLVFLLLYTESINSKTLIDSEAPTELNNEFVLDFGDNYDTYKIRFGAEITAAISFDETTNQFTLNRDLDFSGNTIKNVKIEALSTAPSCGSTHQGRIYFNTSDLGTYICSGTSWVNLNKTSSIETTATSTNSNYNNLAVSTIKVLSNGSTNAPASGSFIVRTLGNDSLKTQVATSESSKYYRIYESSAWSDWVAITTDRYYQYSINKIDQTDGKISYIGREKSTDNSWLITRSCHDGFDYAFENTTNTQTTFDSAWGARTSLTYYSEIEGTSSSSTCKPNDFDLFSYDFSYAQSIPEVSSCSSSENSSYSGANTSPHISWNNLPENTSHITVLMHSGPASLDSDDSTKQLNWAVYNIPVSNQSIVKGSSPSGNSATGENQTNGTIGQNEWNVNSYVGPCHSTGEIDYHIVVYALSESVTLAQYLPSQFESNYSSSILGKAKTYGTFQAP